jgi:hypothetical protein
VVSFTPRPLYPQVKSPWYPLDRRLDELHTPYGRGGEEKNSQSPPGIELKNPNRPIRNLVVIPTELSLLLLLLLLLQGKDEAENLRPLDTPFSASRMTQIYTTNSHFSPAATSKIIQSHTTGHFTIFRVGSPESSSTDVRTFWNQESDKHSDYSVNAKDNYGCITLRRLWMSSVRSARDLPTVQSLPVAKHFGSLFIQPDVFKLEFKTIKYAYNIRSCNNSVGIATRLRAGRSGF